jgi:Cft2 family RNA processing exonuclease
MLFHWDHGLKLTTADLAVDFCRRQPRAFISHAHSDHIARHEYTLCTPETAALLRHRLGERPMLTMPYRAPIDWGGLRLTTLPAGHCLGSAMLLAEDGEESLLYTGDFKLEQPATAERAELATADLLIIESTWGNPQYRLPPREDVLEELLALVRGALAQESVPVIQAYALGKGQEVTRLLTDAEIPVLQHRSVFAVSQIYEACGVKLGEYGRLGDRPAAGSAVVVPPGAAWGTALDQIAGGSTKAGRLPLPTVSIAVTGWAVERGAKYRLGVDHALPLSDHADYDELFEAVARVGPRTVYCTHGPESFVERLRDAGFDAYPLGRPSQRRLF